MAPAARFNQGNALFQKQDYAGAVDAYKDALRLEPGNPETVNNLELALRALETQQQQERDRQERGEEPQEQQRDQQSRAQRQEQGSDRKPSPGGQPPAPPKTEDEKEQERFRKEAGMPRERAMQLLDALQQNEKDEQKRVLAAKQAQKKQGRDW
jgi:Ca-activated chloride channel family protein